MAAGRTQHENSGDVEARRLAALEELRQVVQAYEELIVRLEDKLRVWIDLDHDLRTAVLIQHLEALAEATQALYDARAEITRPECLEAWDHVGRALAALADARASVREREAGAPDAEQSAIAAALGIRRRLGIPSA